MKGNQILGCGLILMSLTLIIKEIIKLPDYIYLILLILGIILEIMGVFKMKKEDKK